MPKTTGLPEDTAPTSDDFVVGYDSAGPTTKKVKYSNLRPIFAAKRVSTIVTSSAPSPNGDTTDLFTVTGLAGTATFAAPSGTPQDGQVLNIRIKDNGTAQTLAWNAIYRVIGVTLPTTTVASKVIYVGCIYNAQDTAWDVVSIGRQS